jgi:hypothetical protein
MPMGLPKALFGTAETYAEAGLFVAAQISRCSKKLLLE